MYAVLYVPVFLHATICGKTLNCTYLKKLFTFSSVSLQLHCIAVFGSCVVHQFGFVYMTLGIFQTRVFLATSGNPKKIKKKKNAL